MEDFTYSYPSQGEEIARRRAQRIEARRQRELQRKRRNRRLLGLVSAGVILIERFSHKAYSFAVITVNASASF